MIYSGARGIWEAEWGLYWASLQLIRRAVPFNPLIHLTASRRPPTCSTTAPSPPGSTEPKHPVSTLGISQQTQIPRPPAPTVFRRQNERACVQAAVAEDLREIEDKAGKQGSWCHIQCALADSRKLIPIPKNLKLLHSLAAQTDFACHTDLFRLRTEESNMDIRTSGHLPVS